MPFAIRSSLKSVAAMRGKAIFLSLVILFGLAAIGESLWLAHKMPQYLGPLSIASSGCRYAEIDNSKVRGLFNLAAAAIGAKGYCSEFYYFRGEGAIPDWNKAGDEYKFGLRISPEDLILRRRHGLASIATARFQDARDDFTKVLQFEPEDTDALTYRGQSREGLDDWFGAVEDYGAAIIVDPKVYGAYTYRGRAYVLLGRYQEGIADLSHASELYQDDLSTILWLYIAQRKTGLNDIDKLRSEIKNIDTRRWPGPAIRYFLGEISATELQRIARTDPEVARFHQACDAWFYLGEEELMRGGRNKARSLFKLTVARCSPEDYEWGAAHLELKKLGK
jgi:lipoprotein NlpI